jgi:hypothetical protein
MTIDEFAKKYGTRGAALIVGEFIRRAPDFPGDERLAKEIGEVMADLCSALDIYTKKFSWENHP